MKRACVDKKRKKGWKEKKTEKKEKSCKDLDRDSVESKMHLQYVQRAPYTVSKGREESITLK